MRRFRKAAALGLAALMAVGSVNFAGVRQEPLVCQQQTDMTST